MFWKHGEIVYNKDEGEITFSEVSKDVIELWRTVSFPLLQKQLKDIEFDKMKRVYQ